VVGTYVALLLLVIFVLIPRAASTIGWVPYFLVGLIVFSVVRYLSTTYTLDDETLSAWRILGGCRVPLEEVRRIEYSSLRDLSPTGGWFGLGSWGWRGRMWSPLIGEFDSIYTDAAHGILVTAGSHPLFLSPVDVEGFAKELSRRVRSYTGPLAKDVGAPAGIQ
jgi:PH (Pleckstrin Homology) domain-containing protein